MNHVPTMAVFLILTRVLTLITAKRPYGLHFDFRWSARRPSPENKRRQDVNTARTSVQAQTPVMQRFSMKRATVCNEKRPPCACFSAFAATKHRFHRPGRRLSPPGKSAIRNAKGRKTQCDSCPFASQKAANRHRSGRKPPSARARTAARADIS